MAINGFFENSANRKNQQVNEDNKSVKIIERFCVRLLSNSHHVFALAPKVLWVGNNYFIGR